MNKIPYMWSIFHSFSVDHDVLGDIRKDDNRKAQARKNARKQRARELTKKRELEIKKEKELTK
jgi:hypothetical protein